jgi:hypothetical protein
MKRTTILLMAVAVGLAAFAVPVLAQTKECNDEFKSATYQKWYDNRKDHQDVAYQAAKEYLDVCSADDSAYKTAIKKFKDAYDVASESASAKGKLQDAYTKKNYPDAVSIGKQVVQSEPDFVPAYLIIALSGYNAATTGNTALLPDAEQAATKALEMVEGGKPFAPFTSKDSAVGWLNYIIGKAKVKNAPADAIPFILKGARLDIDLKKAPGLYIDLAQAYGEGPLAKLAEEYDAKYKGKDESPESKLALANIYQMMDRQIDALARAVALSSGTEKTSYMTALSQVYKDRNKSDAGLNDLVASVLSKPLPDIPTPLTSLPAQTPSSTPAIGGSSGAGGGAQPGTTGAAKSTGTTGSQSGSQTKTGTVTGTGSAKPAATPTPSNKKPRANHRQG